MHWEVPHIDKSLTVMQPFVGVCTFSNLNPAPDLLESLVSMLQVRASSFPPAAIEDSSVALIEPVSPEELSACQVLTTTLHRVAYVGLCGGAIVCSPTGILWW